jgi:CBS-domain-containing membrane protein
MQARDIMTRDVCTITPTTQVDRIATLLLARRISAAPVVDAEGHVLGIVSEGDLMRRSESGTERHRSWWLQLIADPDTLAREYVKSHAMQAKDIMTRNVVSVSPEATIADIADILEARAIKRVPVVDKGRLVGIISRADLLRALVAGSKGLAAMGAADDHAIREALNQRMRAEPWVQSLYINTVVENGVVSLYGFVTSAQQRQALRVLAENLPNVREVKDELVVRSSLPLAS